LRHVRRYEFARTHFLGNTVLDAACGAGYGSDLLEPVEEYVGVDYAHSCIRYAQTNYGAEHRRFVEGDLYSLAAMFPPSSFDTIVSFETLEHLENPERVLSAFRDLLRPTGRLIMSIPLNHPDLVYHKRKYTHEDVYNLLRDLTADTETTLEEYLQKHLQIAPLRNLQSPGATGTWLGILTMGSPDRGPQPE
jgi:2-polyprenyl-3-methyl-5-hydroxy-6-metoxy-1,4-benzoquinol methylase